MDVSSFKGLAKPLQWITWLHLVQVQLIFLFSKPEANILYGTKCTPYHDLLTIYHHAHMISHDIWTPLRWSWPQTEQTLWTRPCYVLVVWTERLSSPCPTAGRNVSFSPLSPVKWISLRRWTWRTVSFWLNNSVFLWCLCVCITGRETDFSF